MATYKTNAIVLRRMPLGETDKIITVFSREYGKFNVIAKGARRTTSRFAGATEPLMYLKAMLAEGMNLDVLTQCDIRESFPRIRADYGLFLRATYACELLDRMSLERAAEPSTFDLLLSTLYILQRATHPDVTIHAYELQLMALMGYEPQLHACIRCEREFDNPRIIETAYSPHRGGILCLVCAEQVKEAALPLSPETATLIRRLSGITDARALAALELLPGAAQEIHRVLREHLRCRLERDVRSTAFLDALRLENSDPTVGNSPGGNRPRLEP